MIRLILAALWIAMLWGILGAILKIVTVETPDWAVMLLSFIGGAAMFFHFFLNYLNIRGIEE